jgi:CBS domain-containing protein
VVDAEGGLVGLISRGDVLRWMRDGATGEELLADVALEVAVAYPDETAGALADRMAQGRYSRVPVIDREDRKLVGIVTRRELLRTRTLALHAEHERHGAVKLPG